MSAVELDPDELDRGASALLKAQGNLTAEAKSIRSAIARIARFRGPEADRFRAQIDQQARQLTAHADALGKQASALRTMAQDVRNLRWR